MNAAPLALNLKIDLLSSGLVADSILGDPGVVSRVGGTFVGESSRLSR